MTDLDDLIAAQRPDPHLAQLAAEPLSPQAARAYPRIVRESITPTGGDHLTARDLELVARTVDLIRNRWGDNADVAWTDLPRVVDEYRRAATSARVPREHRQPAQHPKTGD